MFVCDLNEDSASVLQSDNDSINMSVLRCLLVWLVDAAVGYVDGGGRET